jgi:hypothetical protein
MEGSNKFLEASNIEFNEDLSLYRIQTYDSCDNVKLEYYVVGEDLDDAWRIAMAYWCNKNTSIIGVWEVDIVIGRYYGK